MQLNVLCIIIIVINISKFYFLQPQLMPPNSSLSLPSSSGSFTHYNLSHILKCNLTTSINKYIFILILFALLTQSAVCVQSITQQILSQYINAHRQQYKLSKSLFQSSDLPEASNKIELYIYNSIEYIQLCFVNNLTDTQSPRNLDKYIPKLLQSRSYTPIIPSQLRSSSNESEIKCYNIMNKLELIEQPNILIPISTQQYYDEERNIRKKDIEYLIDEYQMKTWIYQLGREIDNVLTKSKANVKSNQEKVVESVEIQVKMNEKENAHVVIEEKQEAKDSIVSNQNEEIHYEQNIPTIKEETKDANSDTNVNADLKPNQNPNYVKVQRNLTPPPSPNRNTTRPSNPTSNAHGPTQKQNPSKNQNSTQGNATAKRKNPTNSNAKPTNATRPQRPNATRANTTQARNTNPTQQTKSRNTSQTHSDPQAQAKGNPHSQRRKLFQTEKLSLNSLQKFSIITSFQLSNNHINHRANLPSLRLSQLFAQDYHTPQSIGGKIRKRLTGSGLHQQVTYLIKLNYPQHSSKDINNEECQLHIKQVLPHNIYIDVDEIRSHGFQLQVEEYNLENQPIGFINIEKPAYLERQHEYKLVIPWRRLNNTHVDEYVLRVPIHFRYESPHHLKQKYPTQSNYQKSSQEQYAFQFKEVDLYPIEHSEIVCFRPTSPVSSKKVAYTLEEDYLENKGSAHVPVGDGSMKSLVHFITLGSEVLCVILLVRQLRK